MKTTLALICAVLALGFFSPSEAQAGHRRHYSRHHCNSGAVVIRNLVFSAGGGRYCGPSYHSYYRPSYCPPVAYRYYSYPRYCAPPVYYRSYPSRYYYSRGGYRCRY